MPRYVDRNVTTEVLAPPDAEFRARQDSYWSRSAAVGIEPACILRPRSAQEVSEAVRALRSAPEPVKFAVRSGGHMPWPGSNNIAGGVTLDLGRMAWTRYDATSETIDIGPGARWLQVYAEVHRYGRAVAGGRDGNVGVAGLLLGGGISYFTARRGFGCDNLVACEVVLGDGRIVTADAGHHSDLFRALKGGLANFGIVTNFRMKTFPCGNVWGGITFHPRWLVPEAVDALVDFTDNVDSDPDSNLLCFFSYDGSWSEIPPDSKNTVICTVLSNVANVEKAPAYGKWLSLPTIESTCKTTTVLDMLTECSVAPQGYHDMFYTACFKNDRRIVTKAVELHDEFVDKLKAFIPTGDFISQCLFQPLPLLFARASTAAGVNVLGLERQEHNGLILTVSVMVKQRDHEAFAYPKIKSWVQVLQAFAAGIGGNQEWLYANYCDKSQDPIASYGTDNIAFLRDVSAKYDVDGIFHRLCPGGFKLPGCADGYEGGARNGEAEACDTLVQSN
ncbi:hypothetical protein B0I37DRAFT_393320 [Chaetomium sp. MPI-CAGE-AT-0009]|nr:hypothetical protein B0I37DRAFT_393320 [Chaetomium sp. MPI-CAGE-AT-0009]